MANGDSSIDSTRSLANVPKSIFFLCKPNLSLIPEDTFDKVFHIILASWHHSNQFLHWFLEPVDEISRNT